MKKSFFSFVRISFILRKQHYLTHGCHDLTIEKVKELVIVLQFGWFVRKPD